ncbi:PWWP domain-containing protein [Camponotus japonicus]
MCEQTEINYMDGDVVWVKLGACWWPGQVTGLDNLPEDIRPEFQKKPIIAAVKFFQEDTYEFVKNYQQIYKYNCTLKDEFIKKGMDKYRSKSKDGASYMDKFPGDVETAEKLTGGDPDILNQGKFYPEEKPDISALFGEKKIPKKKRDREDGHRRSDGGDMKKITHPRFLRGESDHEVRIRQQPSSLPSTPINTGSPVYRCHFCNFTSSRVNVIICHIKCHRSGDSSTPRSKVKTYSQSHSRISDTSTPKRKYVRKDKSQSSKKKSESSLESGKRRHSKQNEKSSKKKKTDPELREKLLADWEDESDEETIINVNNSLNSSPMKTSSSVDDKEYNEERAAENNEIITETEKLLKDTEELSSIQIQRLSNFDKKSETETDIKISSMSNETFNKSPKKDTSSSDSESKNDKDDKKSRLSCFDFDEDDLSESIPPVRKIPRVFGEKNLSLKKEIIKEFAMSQALKNEMKREAEISELGRNMKLEADEIMEIIQGSDNQQEKKEIKANKDLDENIQDEIETTQPEDEDKKKTMQSKNDQQKSNTNSSEAEVEIVEIVEEREDGNNEHSSNVTKHSETKSKITTPDVSTKSAETLEKIETSDMKHNDDKLLQSEKTDSEDAIIESNDNTSMKEADDTLSERFTTETEDETVSESAETMPEQSENSDTDLLDQDQSIDDGVSGNRIGQPLIKRGRGRPRKNARTANKNANTDKSLKVKTNRGNKRFRLSERIEIERKTSDSDTDRSYSGRRRKPNKKYLESDIYVQDPDYKAFKTDESQSESETKVPERIISKSRRGRRSRGADKKSSGFVTQRDKEEIEVSDQTPTVAENSTSVSSIDMKHELFDNRVSKKETFSEEEEEKSEEVKCDILEERIKAVLDEASVTKIDINVSSENVETTTVLEASNKMEEIELDLDKTIKESSEVKEKRNLIKPNKDIEKNLKDQKKSSILEQIEDIIDKVETQQDISKTSMDMLPPKKSQMKKFESSQDLDTDVQVNKTVDTKLESECKEIEFGSKIEIEFEHQSEFQNDAKERVNEEDEIVIKATVNKITDEIAKILDTKKEEQENLKNSDLQENLNESNKKEQEMQSIEEVLPKSQDVNQLGLKSLETSFETSKPDDADNTPKSPTKTIIEQQLTPKKSSMQTRYKGKFTPETGKGKKDKDLFLEERPANTFQEAFLKTLQMDKKKIEGAESPKGKKEKKSIKKKAEEVKVNIAAIPAQSTKIDDSKMLEVPENIPIEGSDVSVVSNFENIEVVIEEKIEIDNKIKDNSCETTSTRLGSSPNEFIITSKSSENNAKTISDVKKLSEISKTSSVSTSSLSSDISVPVKKREMPRIIENVTLTEPVQILKPNKLSQKGVKHKLEMDVTKKSDQKSGPKAKIMKIETLPSNSKLKTIKSNLPSSHMSLTKKLQVLKTEETDAFLEAQNKEKISASTTQTIVTVPATEKYIQQSSQSLADMELDINSMPFVLSEDVLTPESIEQMPVVISSIIPASSSIPATLSFTPTTQILSPTKQTQFKIANETTVAETSPTKKKSGMPAILKKESKAKPTITSVKTLVPPLTGGVKGLKFQSAQSTGKTPSLLTQKGKYVVVQTAGTQQLRYSVQGKSGTQQKITIPTTGKAAGNAQVIQQGNKVVILTSSQSKMVPLNISKTLSGKMQRIVTSKGQLLCPISPQSSIITSKIIAPKADTAAAIAGSPTTSKLASGSHKIINTQGIITSKGVLTPISGTIAKTALLGTLPQGILTKGGIYTPISASALSGKTIIGSKTLITKGGATLLSSQTQNLGGSKAILTPVSQALAGKTILNPQAIVSSKGTILTPITGQQVKAIAAKSPVKGGKVYQPVQQKVQLPILQKSSKVPISAAGSQTKSSAKSSGGTLILPNTTGTGAQKSTSHGKKSIKQQAVVQPGATINIASPSGTQQTVTMVTQQVQPKNKTATVPKVIIPKTGRQTKTQQKFVVQKVQEPVVSTMQSIHAKQTIATATSANVPIAAKTVAQSKQTISATPPKSSTKSHASSKAQKNLLNIAMNSINTVTTNVNTVTTMALPPLEPIDAEKKAKTDLQLTDTVQKEQGKVEKLQTEKSSVDVEKTEEPKMAAQPQIMALPTESSDGTQTYVLVTIDEQGQIQPLDNNTLMSLEGTTQNPDGTRTLYIDPSSLGEAGTLDNIVLQFDNGILPNIQTNVTEANQTTIITESFPASEVIQTSNQDILAAALANTDFQQEINLPENQASGSVMTQTGLTQTSLINQTILQSTIIPPTEPISSPSVLETSLTLNQPIMTPLEVPSSLPIQSTDSTPTSAVSTIPSSLELPITITNPSISYISATGEPQIQIPGNSMPDIGEIIEGPTAAASSEDIDCAKIPASTQYVVIPNLENNITTAETQNVQSAEIAITPSVSYTVTMPNSIVLENPQVQTTPSMPIIDDTYTDNSQFTTTIVAEQTFVDVPVSEMLVSKAPTVEHMPLEDIAGTSEMIISTHQVPASPQKPIISTDKSSKNSDKEQTATIQEVYSSQEVPITAEELILQQPAKEDSASITMKVAREKKGDNKESDTSMTSLPIIDETDSITSESNSKIEQMRFEVIDSSELKATESHEADTVDKLKQLTFSEGSKTNLLDKQIAGTSNQVETQTASQILPAELLNATSDAIMEVNEAVESELYAGSTNDKRGTEDSQKDEPSSQEESDRRRLRQSMELHFEEEEVAIAEASQETPSQSQYEQFNVSISSDSADLPSQSAGKLESSSGEATQSIAYESMEIDEETVVAEPPSQSFEHSKINEASQSYEVSTEANVNAPTQSFNEIQNQVERPSADEAIDDQSFPTQSYEVDKRENTTEDMETDAEISQEGNIPSQSNDIGADGIGTSSVSTNNSGLNEDETASSSYVPETPENQERDQDQESAISTSSYEIPPCEELNIASSSVIPDTSVSTEHTGIHDNGVPEIPTSSSYNLNPDITSTHHVDSVPTSSYDDQVIVEQNVSTSYEVPISMPGLEETCSQNFVTESGDHHQNEPSSYYAHHQEVTASYYESVDQDANSRLEEDPHEEHVTPGGYYEGNPQEVSQSYFAPAEEETPNYTSHSISSGYYDPSRPESEASQSYYSTDDLDGKTEEQSSSSSPNIEASQSFYQERSGELRLRQQGEATPTYSEGYPVDYTLENSPIERHDLVESSVPATRPMDR